MAARATGSGASAAPGSAPTSKRAPPASSTSSRSAINLNVHFHALTPDGVFELDEDGRARFVSLPPPEDERYGHHHHSRPIRGRAVAHLRSRSNQPRSPAALPTTSTWVAAIAKTHSAFATDCSASAASPAASPTETT